MDKEDTMSFEKETKKLTKHWKQYDKKTLKTYLTLNFHHPSMNLQSTWTRHFLIKEVYNNKYKKLMKKEINHIQSLNQRRLKNQIITKDELYKYTYVWQDIFKQEIQTNKIKVLEPACGSANDYKILNKQNMDNILEYTGFDLCVNNVTNCKEMFPSSSFKIGNVLTIDDEDSKYDYVIVFDLIEHLSLEAGKKALDEMIRVSKKGVVVNFFNMEDDIDKSVENPVDLYHWNTLSKKEIKKYCEEQNLKVTVKKVWDFIPHEFKYRRGYNKKHYTFFMRKNEN